MKSAAEVLQNNVEDLNKRIMTYDGFIQRRKNMLAEVQAKVEQIMEEIIVFEAEKANKKLEKESIEAEIAVFEIV